MTTHERKLPCRGFQVETKSITHAFRQILGAQGPPLIVGSPFPPSILPACYPGATKLQEYIGPERATIQDSVHAGTPLTKKKSSRPRPNRRKWMLRSFNGWQKPFVNQRASHRMDRICDGKSEKKTGSIPILDESNERGCDCRTSPRIIDRDGLLQSRWNYIREWIT